MVIYNHPSFDNLNRQGIFQFNPGANWHKDSQLSNCKFNSNVPCRQPTLCVPIQSNHMNMSPHQHAEPDT